MKRNYLLFLVIICFLITGCSFFEQPDFTANIEASYGKVNINLGGSARTILPSQFGLDNYFFVLQFTPKNIADAEPFTEYLDDATSITLVLELGTWELEVRGYVSEAEALEDDSDSALVYGIEEIKVLTSGITSVTVELLPKENVWLSKGNGTLNYSIIIPQGASGTFTIQRFGDNDKEEIALSEENTDELSLASGFYHIYVIAEHKGKTAFWRELVYIYYDAVTIADKTFATGDFKYSAAGLIDSFRFSLEYVIINQEERTIDVIIPHTANIKALSPVITHTGSIVLPTLGVPQDFTDSVEYRVYARDGSYDAYTVNVNYAKEFITISELSSYLAGITGDSVDNPIPVKVNIDLDTYYSTLISTLNAAEKYVSLDLSGSTGMQTFDPGTANTGEKYVVSLALPDSSTEISAGINLSNSTFRFFANLSEVIGSNIVNVGNNAFRNCTSLTSVNLPVATNISSYAFYSCTSMISVILPAATSIGDYAFGDCTSLSSVYLPVATSIGEYAFYVCTNLTSVNLPAATSIASGAFYHCTSLISVSLPVATNIGDYAFYVCTNLTSVNLPAATSIGDYAFGDCTSLSSVYLPVATSTMCQLKVA